MTSRGGLGVAKYFSKLVQGQHPEVVIDKPRRNQLTTIFGSWKTSTEAFSGGWGLRESTLLKAGLEGQANSMIFRICQNSHMPLSLVIVQRKK